MGMKKYFHGMWVAVLFASALVGASIVPTYISDGLMTWERDVEGSTWQQWSFDTAQEPASPELSNNPYGNPLIEFTGSDGSVDFGWEDGVWMGDPVRAVITVPNNPQNNPYKTVWFEMVYKAVTSILPDVTAGKGYQIEQTAFNDRPLCEDWRIMTISWTIMPNPFEETFTFALAGTGGFVTSVAIDTICVAVPEPATMTLLSMGLGFFGWIRKRSL